jgi:hypothetical protein
MILTSRKFFLLLAVLLITVHDAYSAERCVNQSGLRVCVQMKGPCDLAHLMPREKTKVKMDLFYITFLNNSDRRVTIDPEYFYGITASGYAVKLDAPLYASIELKTKLRRRDLGPQEQTRGHLFFPSSMGPVRTLIYEGDFLLEIQLF